MFNVRKCKSKVPPRNIDTVYHFHANASYALSTPTSFLKRSWSKEPLSNRFFFWVLIPTKCYTCTTTDFSNFGHFMLEKEFCPVFYYIKRQKIENFTRPTNQALKAQIQTQHTAVIQPGGIFCFFLVFSEKDNKNSRSNNRITGKLLKN